MASRVLSCRLWRLGFPSETFLYLAVIVLRKHKGCFWEMKSDNFVFRCRMTSGCMKIPSSLSPTSSSSRRFVFFWLWLKLGNQKQTTILVTCSNHLVLTILFGAQKFPNRRLKYKIFVPARVIFHILQLLRHVILIQGTDGSSPCLLGKPIS